MRTVDRHQPLKHDAKGIFIVFEGIEGVGKSTQLQFAAEMLRKRGLTVITTREPGGTPLGESLRTILLDPRNRDICEEAELLMMFAARAQHLTKVIRPALDAGSVVLCDRFTDATYAYQGGGRGGVIKQIALLESLVHPDLQPDLVVLLDAPVNVALNRLSMRPGRDRFEQESLDFFNRARSTYLTRADNSRDRYVVLDASVPVEQVREQLQQTLDTFLER